MGQATAPAWAVVRVESRAAVSGSRSARAREPLSGGDWEAGLLDSELAAVLVEQSERWSGCRCGWPVTSHSSVCQCRCLW